MTNKPFLHRTEGATDLLGLIHTDVCGTLRHVSRQGASYFITFTDDFRRYGFVYLLKHKHEIFKTFKFFKNEVKNQLGKTIKAFRLDRGGKYIGQEFKDYLKSYGIVKQLTPPYIPQHNGVFERRNRTLLQIVRSMINLTTLPLSFWDYALESATRILNIVPTKKVDTTSYELWYAEFLEKNIISQKATGRAIELEKFKMKIHHLLKTLVKFMLRLKVRLPQEEVAYVCRSRGHIPGVGRVLPGQGTVISPPSQSTHSADIARLKKREKLLMKQVNMLMRLFRSDDKFSQMLTQLESQPEYGGGSGSGWCGMMSQEMMRMAAKIRRRRMIVRGCGVNIDLYLADNGSFMTSSPVL
nr:retrotransposon protein, putative, Ty1-copia subclass [Tanacetum cinerariifolium]